VFLHLPESSLSRKKKETKDKISLSRKKKETKNKMMAKKTLLVLVMCLAVVVAAASADGSQEDPVPVESGLQQPYFPSLASLASYASFTSAFAQQLRKSNTGGHGPAALRRAVQEVDSSFSGIPEDSPVPFVCLFAAEDCSNQGVCNRNGTACICNHGFVTYNPPTGAVQCNHALKHQEIVYWLAFVNQFSGATYFYLGRQELGVLSIFLGPVGCLILALVALVAAVCAPNQGPAIAGWMKIIGTVCIAAGTIWSIVILVMAANNNIEDSDGFLPRSW
jgi:hypothetical protein